MVWFDGEAGPGWHDYLGLVITIVGFGLAFLQLRRTRKATTAATDALYRAQHDVARMAFMSMIPQVQTVVDDLTYAMPANDREVARRALVRFSILGGETREILGSVGGDYSRLMNRLIKVASRATLAKAELVTTPEPDVIAIAKVVSAEIDQVHQELAKIAAQMRNRIEGAVDVQ